MDFRTVLNCYFIDTTSYNNFTSVVCEETGRIYRMLSVVAVLR